MPYATKKLGKFYVTQQWADRGGHSPHAAVYFGYGINLDSSKLHVGILLEQQSKPAQDLANAFANSPYIAAQISDDREALIHTMQAGTIRGLIVIPNDFAEQLARPEGKAPIQVITDGSEPNTANFVQGYAQGVWQLWQQQQTQNTGQKMIRSLRFRCAIGLTPRQSADTLLFPALSPLL